MKKTLAPLVLGLSCLWQNACSGPSLSDEDAHLRGSEDFKTYLKIGAGSNRGAVPENGASFGLSASQEGIISVSRDPASDSWSWVLFDTTQSAAVASSAELEAFSRSFVAKFSADLGVLPGELLSFDKTIYQPLAGYALVTFTRSYMGRPVKDAYTQLVFNQMPEGPFRLREVVNQSFGAIQVSGEPVTPPATAAISASGIDGLEPESVRELIVPRLNASGTYDFVYATEYVLSDKQFGERFTVTLDNASQDILEAYSNKIYAKHELLLNTYTHSYVFKDEKPRPFAFVGIGAPGALTAEADEKGVLDTALTTTNIVLATTKSHAGIVDLTVANNRQFYSFPVTLPAAGGKTTINLTQADPAALNTFLAVHEVTEFVKPFLAGVTVPLLVNGIQANVNMQDANLCNAFYNGASINFFRQGNGCANTALINDIVYHEWGHALDDDLGVTTTPNGIVDGAFSEGIGDIMGFLMTGKEQIGSGIILNNANGGVRTVNNTKRHPPANAQEAEVHEAGQIIGGAVWDLRKNLVALYGPEEGNDKTADLMLKHLTMADRYIESYAAMMRLDDNDNNPATRSPHYCSITKAFAAHNLTGGIVEGDTCIDVDQGIKVRVDVDQGGGSLSLVASSYAADSIIACPGKVTTCVEGTSGAVVFEKDSTTGNKINGTALNSKLFYQGKATLETKAGAEVFTFFSRDASKKAIGFKTLQFKARDQSADLSATAK